MSHKKINNSTNVAYIFEEAYTRFEKKIIVLLSAINTIEMQLLISRRTKEKVVFTAIFVFVEKNHA